MELINRIRTNAQEFVTYLSQGVDIFTGEKFGEEPIKFTKEHKFYFKFIGMDMEASGKFSQEEYASIVSSYKEMLVDVYHQSPLNESELIIAKALHKEGLSIKEISDTANLLGDAVEIALFEEGIIKASNKNQKPDSDKIAQTLQQHDWKDINLDKVLIIAKDIRKGVKTTIKHALALNLITEDDLPAGDQFFYWEKKRRQNLENGLKENHGMKWLESDDQKIVDFDWYSTNRSEVESLSNELGRTYGSIVSRARRLQVIDADRSMVINAPHFK